MYTATPPILFNTPRIVVRREGSETGEASVGIALSGGTTKSKSSVTLGMVDDSIRTIDVTGELTKDKDTGIITFSSSDGDFYYIRRLRQEDGYWLSDLKMPLPVAALLQKINFLRQADEMKLFPSENDSEFQKESLFAFTFPGRKFIVGLFYRDPINNWLRVDGAWLKMGDMDEFMYLSDAQMVEINPDRAEEFVDLFDDVYLDINMIDEYLTPNYRKREELQ